MRFISEDNVRTHGPSKRIQPKELGFSQREDSNDSSPAHFNEVPGTSGTYEVGRVKPLNSLNCLLDVEPICDRFFKPLQLRLACKCQALGLSNIFRSSFFLLTKRTFKSQSLQEVFCTPMRISLYQIALWLYNIE